ncbi:hypothetical protein [Planctomicrobium sp. SH527]|uniref:hypothetical protein n=1 Tax=Planctomicrobium sp. SH527 TaxID=3448123 RepID=UPI003F5B6FD2
MNFEHTTRSVCGHLIVRFPNFVTIRRFLVCWGIVLGVLGASSSNLMAEDEPVEISGASVGFNGTFKVGRWTPVEFDVSGPAGTTLYPVIRTADPDGQATLQPLPAVELKGKTVHVRGLARSGRIDGSVQVQLYDSEAAIGLKPLTHVTLRNNESQQFTPVKLSTQLWLALGKQPMLSKGMERWNQGREEFVRLVEFADATGPLWTGKALDGVDALVIAGDTALTQEVSNSIRDWVGQGGRLIVPVGDAVSAIKESPMASWLPILPKGKIEVVKLTGLNELVPRSSTLRTLTTLPAGQFDKIDGTVIASGLSDSLVIRAPYGLGHVTMLAIRMDSPPLVNWEPESQGQFAIVLAGLPNPSDLAAAQVAKANAASEMNPAAVTDVQMQLNQSLDHFAGISRPSHWQVIGWIVLFALVIGPLDYWIVTKVLKRPELTWVTVAAWSLIVAGLAYSHGNSVNQHEAVSRQIEFVDIDAASRTVSVRSWFGFYSDVNQRVEISSEANSADLGGVPVSQPVSVSWVNRPGEGFRGMYRTGGVDESLPAYAFNSAGDGVQNLPVNIWSSGAIASEWNATLAGKELPVTSELSETGINRLAGTVSHQLPGELTDWFLAYNDFAFFDRSGPNGKPVPLTAGQEWNLAEAGSNLLRGRLLTELERLAQASDRIDSEAEMRRSAYDTMSINPFLIGLTTSFYQVLGGEQYTTLQNQSLGRMDVSELLKLHRAVLIGRMKISPLTVKLNGQVLPEDERTVLVRFILPVKPAERSSDAPPSTDILNYRR